MRRGTKTAVIQIVAQTTIANGDGQELLKAAQRAVEALRAGTGSDAMISFNVHIADGADGQADSDRPDPPPASA